MIHVDINNDYKSIKGGTVFDIPDFVVLTGKNGSGKSHLMEVLANNKPGLRDVLIDGVATINVKYIPFNGLNPNISDLGSYEQLVHKQKEIWVNIREMLQECQQEMDKGHASSFEDYICRYGRPLNSDIKEWFDKADHKVENLTEKLVNKHFHVSESEMFSSQFASIFKLYHLNLEDNSYAEYRHNKFGDDVPFLSSEEFEKQYGPKPWVLINDMLRNAHLSYEVNNPEGLRREEDFNLHLTDVNSGVEIKVADLSTGEKVLMSLALAIYNTQEQTARPDILLLDEPDAALHPEFSKVLLDAIQNSIVGRAKVKVMITTHSPSTVALAPEDCVYMMNKALSRPEKVSKKRAVGILTQDITDFHISVDSRRQVFVESPYDVQYYTKILSLVDKCFEVTPVFLEPHSHDGTNCTDVIEIVNDLRNKGNDLVYGIIDYDNKNTSSDYVLVLGEKKRYAIDNYIFDPIFVAFLLIHEKICTSVEMGGGTHKFIDLVNINDVELQNMIDYVANTLSLNISPAIDYEIQNGKRYHVSGDYFTIQGHDLENRIKEKWPALKAIAKNKDNLLKNYVLERIADAYPQYLSADFKDLLSMIE